MAIPKFHDERNGGLPEKYFTALGHLQHAYTNLEVQLTCTISELITVGYHPGEHAPLMARTQAVLGGMRMNDAKDTLKRLMRVSEAPPEVIDYLNQLLHQLSEIQFFRNRLTHYMTTRRWKKRGQFLNTDMDVAKEDSKAVTFIFDYDALDAARHDLYLLSRILDEMFDWEGRAFILEPPAWQYKPSMLAR